MMKDVEKLVMPTPFAVGDVYAYLIKGERLTLVDAGVNTEEAFAALQKQLAEKGYKFEDIEQVIITHHHPDHVGLLDRFGEDVPIIGHRKNGPWIAQDEVFLQKYEQWARQLFVQFGVDERFFSLLKRFQRSFQYSCRRSLTETVQEGDVVLGEWRVLETPGHAQSHIVLYRERDGVMIGGDLLLAHISSNPLLEPPLFDETERPKALVQYRQSLQRLLDYDISVLLPGHGSNVTNVHELVRTRLKKQEVRLRMVKEMLSKPITVYELCQKLFSDVYETQLMLTLSQTIGYLDVLEERDEIVVERAQLPWMYTAK
ncbi:glyoxylase-like metal-dependent hydrolase (beta-lactamase superfamily II) [Thermolongibacillus altinsuensis]|jgi:glyoxylase-like metal-dependent hydrolase (beta-lactamase superfamily II)|uniref:Glyoxylase-like metal-dependent hydrolase (Beta-lactamase superfamily II) n=1 Tax=Thermolongibacillus altinsuensis TaxID=575256 RepID=A0A4R1QSJ1_9BACL|nr:MBL fold metallo-hydrolase [Thermolongibacillus altinsuensis]TCL53030.1 glyoxylase-like metal-dependent hydrolase (beta-lactamase superfamily II) [Thermolongibacillus altinsuensis]GMB07732.1 hydrolase [Thermolongibacillus altinsuensis]